MSSMDPYEAPAGAGDESQHIRWRVALAVAAMLLLAQGVVFTLRLMLAALGLPFAPLDLMTLAGIVGASAMVSSQGRRRVAITPRETVVALMGFALAHTIASVVLAAGWLVTGQINVIQLAVAIMAFVVFTTMGTVVERSVAGRG